MRKIILTLLLSAYILGLNAQISVLDTDMGSIGDVFVTATDTGVTGFDFMASASANQTWDLSMLNTHTTDTVSFLDPAATANGADFPTASVCLYQSSAQTFNYINVNTSALEVVGVAGDISGTGNPISAAVNPSRKLLVFPFTYGTTYLDTSTVDKKLEFTAIPFVDSARYKSLVYLDVIGDAWGTLILGQGTYNSVRQREVSRSIDSIWIHSAFGGWTLFDNTDVTDTSFTWWDKTRGFLLAGANLESGVTNEITYLDPNPVGISDGFITQGDISAFPVPSQSGVVYLTSKAAISGKVEVFDLKGMRIYGADYQGTQTKMDLSGNSAGVYIYRVQDTNSGKMHSGRIILD